MTLSLDSSGQLLAGLHAALTTGLSGLVAGANIRAAWPDAQLVTALATGSASPLVIVVLDPERAPARAANSARDTLGPITAGTSTTPSMATHLVEVTRRQTPVRFVIAAGGERGKTVRGRVAQALMTALSTVLPNGEIAAFADVPLPDDMDSAGTIPGDFGLSARLVYTGAREDNALDARQVYRYDLTYLATHSVYRAVTQTITEAVDFAMLTRATTSS